jgi:hypothetical protein
MDHEEITAAIDAGELDGNLDPIATAIVNRSRSGAVQMAWRLRYDGDEWTEQTVTLGELKFAENHAAIIDHDIRGFPVRRRALMWEIDPRGNAEHAVALIVAHLHKAQGVSLEDAIKRAEAIPANQLADVIGEFEVVAGIDLPKDDPISEASTTTTPTA